MEANSNVFIHEPISTPDTKVKLNVGCGRNILPGWINIDSRNREGVDIVQDLDNIVPDDYPRWREGCLGGGRLAIENDTVDEFLLSHFLEHVHNSLALMQELHRIAKPRAKMVIRCPYGSSDDAWEDPTHVRPYFTGSFGYFAQHHYWRADYGYRGDWQVKRITLLVDPATPQNISLKIFSERNIVKEMIAELYAVKPIREPKRELQEVPEVIISS